MHGLVLNEEHLGGALAAALGSCRHRLFIATADVKDLHVPLGPDGAGRRDARSIIEVFGWLSQRRVEIRLLHGGVPSQPFLTRLKRQIPPTLTMRRCPRVHVKAVIADSRWMYLGSANLTGAGLGAKSPHRRNFEAGIWTDEQPLIDGVLDMLDGIWQGRHCAACGRKEHCPAPLEEPDL